MPRVHRKVLYLPKRQGGLAVPDLHLYYETVILSKLIKHYSKDYVTGWKAVEDAVFSSKSLGEILWMLRKHRPNQSKYSILLKATLSTWDPNVAFLTSPTSKVRTFLGQD